MNKLFKRFLLVLPYLIVFIFSLYKPIDPDLGWHLKYGEYFFQHGSVLRDNTFATMMPDYHWANTSWLTDVVTYGVYHLGGFFGLTLLGALVVTLTFFFFSRAAQLSLWDEAFLFPFILFLEQPLNSVSFRGQLLTILFIGVMLYLLHFYRKKQSTFLLIIPLFFAWANFHGEFPLGLALFAAWIVFFMLTRLKTFWKEDARVLLTVFIVSGLVTIINPFGIGIHLAAISHFGSPLLKDITEYLPFTFLSQEWWNQVFIGIALLFGVLFLYFKGSIKDKIPLLGVSIIVFLFSFEVKRYAWPAYYLMLPMLQPLSSFFKPDNKKIASYITIGLLLVVLTRTMIAQYPYTNFVTFNWNNYCDSNVVACSPKSANYLISHHLTKNVFSLYGWGGWLIWQYPQIKPVIDGRMHLWKDEKNGYSAFVDYYGYEQDMKDINKSSYNIVYMPSNKPIYQRLQGLVMEGQWSLVYSDENAGIFVRNKN